MAEQFFRDVLKDEYLELRKYKFTNKGYCRQRTFSFDYKKYIQKYKRSIMFL